MMMFKISRGEKENDRIAEITNDCSIEGQVGVEEWSEVIKKKVSGNKHGISCVNCLDSFVVSLFSFLLESSFTLFFFFFFFLIYFCVAHQLCVRGIPNHPLWWVKWQRKRTKFFSDFFFFPHFVDVKLNISSFVVFFKRTKKKKYKEIVKEKQQILLMCFL